jgi:hypothetical protein
MAPSEELSEDVLSLLPVFLPGVQFVDRDGKVVSGQRWHELMVDEDYRQIGFWESDEVSISTVWVGRLMTPNTRLLPFETMVFAGPRMDGAAWDCQGWSWATAEEARQGHARIVKAVQEHGVAALEREQRSREQGLGALLAMLDGEEG